MGVTTNITGRGIQSYYDLLIALTEVTRIELLDLDEDEIISTISLTKPILKKDIVRFINALCLLALQFNQIIQLPEYDEKLMVWGEIAGEILAYRKTKWLFNFPELTFMRTTAQSVKHMFLGLKHEGKIFVALNKTQDIEIEILGYKIRLGSLQTKACITAIKNQEELEKLLSEDIPDDTGIYIHPVIDREASFTEVVESTH